MAVAVEVISGWILDVCLRYSQPAQLKNQDITFVFTIESSPLLSIPFHHSAEGFLLGQETGKKSKQRDRKHDCIGMGKQKEDIKAAEE